jgi:hypothetical protein
MQTISHRLADAAAAVAAAVSIPHYINPAIYCSEVLVVFSINAPLNVVSFYSRRATGLLWCPFYRNRTRRDA